MAEGNPLLTRLRHREGIFGALHRRNLWIITAAALFHVGVVTSLLALGWSAVLAIFTVFTLLFIALASVAAVATVSHQVRAARLQGTWDELLITMLSDREIVNGLIMLALRPTFQLLWLASPSYVVCALAVGIVLVREEGMGGGLVFTAGFIVLAVCLLGGVMVLVLCMAVLALNASLKKVGAVGRLVLFLLTLVPLLLAPVLGLHLISYLIYLPGLLLIGPLPIFIWDWLLLALLPLFLIIPAMCWYQYRVLCCTLRQRILSESESG